MSLYIVASASLAVLLAMVFLANRADRLRRRRDDMAAVERITESWKPRPRSRNPKTGRFRKTYATFTVRNSFYHEN